MAVYEKHIWWLCSQVRTWKAFEKASFSLLSKRFDTLICKVYAYMYYENVNIKTVYCWQRLKRINKCINEKIRFGELFFIEIKTMMMIEKKFFSKLYTMIIIWYFQWLLAYYYSQTHSALGLSNIGLGLYLDGWPL